MGDRKARHPETPALATVNVLADLDIGGLFPDGD